MTAQRHIIKRQVVELQIGGAIDAQQLQTEVSRIYRQRIVPLIDRYCSELSAPELIHRIDSLELNVGTIHPQHLEENLVAKVDNQLRALLAEQITADERKAKNSGADRKTASHLELFSVFAQTGSVPWWADSSHPHLLDNGLQYLMLNAPGPLRRLMRELAQEQFSLQRIVRHFDDRFLANLAAVLASSLNLATFAHLVHDLVLVLQNMTSGASQRQTRLRHRVWGVILQRANLKEEGETTWPPFFQAVLIRIARELGFTYPALLSGVRQVVQQDHTRFQSPIRAIIETLYTELSRTEPTRLVNLLRDTPHPVPLPLGERAAGALATASEGYVTQTSGDEELSQQVKQLPEASRAFASLWRLLGTLAARLPEPSQAPVLVALGRLESGPMDSAAFTVLISLLQSVLAQHHFPPILVPRWRAKLEQLARLDFSPARVPALTELLQDVLQQISSHRVKDARPGPARREQGAESIGASKTVKTLLNLTFNDTDELYIDNAGLVILHPFLRHFFERLELLEDKQFPDLASRQRAIGLLQYAVSEDPAPPEYLLPLNKVLCGVELDDVFDFGPPVTETEVEECTSLLTAVIANAPILKNMSINGLRGTFLLRPGVLSSRDGAWLLRVERETYDVVLDRFPWTLQWVKLPWMDTPLRVEW